MSRYYDGDYYEQEDRSNSRHRTQTKMSLEEAERLLEVDARLKDFWSLDNGVDNLELLQEAMDVVFNKIPGNQYEIDYQENQNSCRLIVRCVTCDKELSSYDPFITHEKGKPHKKVRQQKLCPKDPNIQAGLQKQPHNLPKGIFEPGSLEDLIDSCRDPILGVQFLFKEVKDQPYFTCTLCLRKKGSKVEAICQNKMYKHLLGETHSETYMKVKFGINHQPGFDGMLCKYAEFEGSIHVPIIDFTNQMILEAVKNEKCSKYLADLRILGDIKKEKETKFRPKPVKRERSSSGESGHGSKRINHITTNSWSSDEEMRSTSPRIWAKEEISSPTMSPVREILQPTYQDAETMTEYISAKSSIRLLAEEAVNLKSPDAHDQLLEDVFMQALLHEAIVVLNRNLAAYFKEHDTMCWDEKGDVVNKAYDCAMNLEKKHLKGLQTITQDLY